MTTIAETQSNAPADRDIRSTRLFPFPRETLFRAFTDPTILARWWGPAGFTNTFHEFSPHPGGLWRFTMHAPDGTDYPITKRFVEVTPPDRIVFDHVQEGHGFRMTMTFADEAGQTRLTWHMRFDSADEAARVRAFVLQANGQNFDRLAAVLTTMG